MSSETRTGVTMNLNPYLQIKYAVNKAVLTAGSVSVNVGLF